MCFSQSSICSPTKGINYNYINYLRPNSNATIHKDISNRFGSLYSYVRNILKKKHRRNLSSRIFEVDANIENYFDQIAYEYSLYGDFFLIDRSEGQENSLPENLRASEFLKNRTTNAPQVFSLNSMPIAFSTSNETLYSTPDVEEQAKNLHSMIVFDAKGRSLTRPSVQKEIRNIFEKYGCVHITNTGYLRSLPQVFLDALGFKQENLFIPEGQNSGLTHDREELGQGFIRSGDYPHHLTLAAHNEITYQRKSPELLLLHFRKTVGFGYGGRVFLHSANLVEKILRSYGSVGNKLANDLIDKGQIITTGFLDQKHPEYKNSYVRSWQERFETMHIEEALTKCLNSKSQFDDCWIKMVKEGKNRHPFLMTKVRVSRVKKDDKGKNYMLFPRIALDQPKEFNGFRQFNLGNGRSFSRQELQIILESQWKTRQGIYQKPGDILIFNNYLYGHSREPIKLFNHLGEPLEREVALLMAGKFILKDFGR